jgi:ATP-dependent Clp protease ATP-binding subunit ClpA
MQLDNNYIGTEHILLGLLRENDGVGAAVLRSSGADIRTLRQRVIELAREADDEPVEQRDSLNLTSASAPSPMSLVARSDAEHPLCPICASSLAEGLKWRRVTASGEGDEREALVTYCGSCGRAFGVLP